MINAELNEMAIDIGLMTSFHRDDAEHAMEILIESGLNTREIIVALPNIMRLAIANDVCMETIASLIIPRMEDFTSRFSQSMIKLAYSMRGEIRGYTRRTIEILMAEPLAVNDRSTTLVHYHSAPHLSEPLGHPWYSTYRRRSRARRARRS